MADPTAAAARSVEAHHDVTQLAGKTVGAMEQLPAGEDRLIVRYTARNLRPRELRYLWKLHPALSISPGDRIGFTIDAQAAKITGVKVLQKAN